MRLWHVLIITAIAIPVFIYFGLNPNQTATNVILILFVVGFVALRIWQIRRVARAIRDRSPSAPVPVTWSQPPPQTPARAADQGTLGESGIDQDRRPGDA